MKQIVIVGAGFGGLQAALGLEKKFSNDKSVQITLVDKRDYHLFTPNLYEAATTEEELVSVKQVKKSITLPLIKILNGKKIKFIQGQVELIDSPNKQIKVASKKLDYDFLVLALGSQSDFFNIEGAEKNAMVLKDLPDALRIRNQINFAIELHKNDFSKKTIRLVVAGGGYTGLEFASEMKGLVDYLAWKNQYPREKIEIEVIEAANKVIPGFDPQLSEDAYFRLQDLGIHVRLAARISKVDNHFIELLSGEKISYDVLVWTAGVRAHSMNIAAAMALDNKGRLPVNEFFQTKEFPNIFALGDVACVMGTNHQPVPGSAQDAIDQAKYLVYAMPYIMKNQKPPQPYKNSKHGFIVSLGGKWAIVDNKPVYIKGFIGYIIAQGAHIRYFFSILSPFKALKFWFSQEVVNIRND